MIPWIPYIENSDRSQVKVCVLCLWSTCGDLYPNLYGHNCSWFEADSVFEIKYTVLLPVFWLYYFLAFSSHHKLKKVEVYYLVLCLYHMHIPSIVSSGFIIRLSSQGVLCVFELAVQSANPNTHHLKSLIHVYCAHHSIFLYTIRLSLQHIVSFINL